jgi:hypothetical protein
MLGRTYIGGDVEIRSAPLRNHISSISMRAGMKFGVDYSSIGWHYLRASAYLDGNSNRCRQLGTTSESSN